MEKVASKKELNFVDKATTIRMGKEEAIVSALR
jgi:hypothetical protein